MLKLFGFRVTPFFLFILGLECLALLVSIYLGALLYKGTPISVSLDSHNPTINTGVLLIFLIAILTPGFFSQLNIINKVKKSLNELLPGLISSLLMMLVIVLTNHSNLDARMLFLAALLSASFGLIINNLSMFGKYWRFLVRSGVN